MSDDYADKLLRATVLLSTGKWMMSREEERCFLLVATNPGITVGQLAERARLPQSTVSRHLKALSSRKSIEKRGKFIGIEWSIAAEFGGPEVIDEQIHPINPKQKALFVSENGQTLLSKIRAIHECRDDGPSSTDATD
ncbi:MAG: winged helix-turn-helix domain-containing protein [Proteobacteria bacterium]|nr:winged helix-turn-helix domain-containing protein [Pseudomonadota bacterium]